MLIICIGPQDSFGDDCIEGDCVNGKGIMVYATGHKFTGEFKDGGRHGDGMLHMPGGRKIVGTWQNNEIVEGTFTKPDGTQYIGQWKFRERNGKGTLTFPDGRKYIGEFKGGERTGQGTLIYPDGKRLVGKFRNGEFVGEWLEVGIRNCEGGIKREEEAKKSENKSQRAEDRKTFGEQASSQIFIVPLPELYSNYE